MLYRHKLNRLIADFFVVKYKIMFKNEGKCDKMYIKLKNKGENMLM